MQVLPALDIVRALLLDATVAGKVGSAAMGSYSLAYTGDGGPSPDKIALAQAQDVVLKLLMAAAAKDAPAPVVLMAQRALCNGFIHAAMAPLLQLHLNTAAVVLKDIDAAHKQVGVRVAGCVCGCVCVCGYV